ncbi:cell envelope biogenesis protein OmpA [Thiomicrospira sp. XS5]|uniref:OmpA/MotB family protein n=1 Tax=Thiomicrospira sp. XS5 TaxID=1775636 RepID=UPI0007494A25|nr:OmpA family protein [Thiomicrospira sp. XS5]KUJ74513.1 cell envelope biogenesis protein OmpA [Thiomicrospira sp. XS5]
MKSETIVQAEEVRATQRMKRNQAWQIVFIALFTSLLAFFVLIISMVELEGSKPKRDYQRLVNNLYQDSVHLKEQLGLEWLNVENTLSKGVRFTLDESDLARQDLFAPARARVNPRYLPYINRFVQFLDELDLPTYGARHQKLVNSILRPDEKFQVTIRVEGHTDASPLAKTALYRSNFELSTFRAYAIMSLLKLYTGLPDHFFAIAGYGSFRPVTENPLEPENRRVEIYLVPQLVPIEEGP